MIASKFRFVRKLSCAPQKPFYVTTPIFYVNASPHIGHLYSAVVADAICRFNEIRNPQNVTKLSTGTDEHGSKIQQSAANHKVPVREYCDRISQSYRQMFDLAGIQYTDFIRTTESRHVRAVQNFWLKLKANDRIYSTTYSGWYCISDETFLTDSQLKENPDGSKVSAESGHTVEWTDEVNYMFKLSELQEDILYWIKNGDRIKPVKFEKILLDYLNEPLPDVSISRPSSRVHWGIKVPHDETQTVYVWLDALVNYLTCAGYPDKFSENWPPVLHVIGKDILKFHGIYWPAFLIAAGLEPPQQLFVHSHWTVDGQKMSKSKFNVVDPIERSQLCTMEGLRYFLLREGVSHSDGNYSDVKLIRILNSELADTIGNLLSRACAKSLNPRQIFPKFHSEKYDELLREEPTKRLIDAVSELPEKCLRHYESCNFYLVVDHVIAVLHASNNFFESTKPWELKRKNSSDKETIADASNIDQNALKLETIITITMETLRICAIILQPIIPVFSGKLLDKLNVDATKRCWTNVNQRVWDAGCSNRLTATNLSGLDPVLFKRIILDSDKPKKIKKHQSCNKV